jgi:hypothetical protein
LSWFVFCPITELVAQIEFTEWTPDNHLRHSRFVGLREDKEVRDVVRFRIKHYTSAPGPDTGEDMAIRSNVKQWALLRILALETRYGGLESDPGFIAEIVAVHLYARWERYAEERLTDALVRHPAFFLSANGVRRLKSIPRGLALALVRDGRRYFDFRSVKDLIKKGDRLVDKQDNPFRRLTPQMKAYLDALGAIRNHIVHASDSATVGYKRQLSKVYGFKSKPYVEGFLNVIDHRPDSPARHKERIVGLMTILKQVVNVSS